MSMENYAPLRLPLRLFIYYVDGSTGEEPVGPADNVWAIMAELLYPTWYRRNGPPRVDHIVVDWGASMDVIMPDGHGGYIQEAVRRAEGSGQS
jgi:hypothetical protein